MNVIISGSAGIALLVEGELFFSLDIDRPGELAPCSADEVALLFGDARDHWFVEGVGSDAAWLLLEQEWDRAEALAVTLILLDVEMSDATRLQAACDLEETLSALGSLERLEAVLYARPLPGAMDISSALLLCARVSANAALGLIGRVQARQAAIREVTKAFSLLPMKVFGENGRNRAHTKSALVRGGVFRDFVSTRANGQAISTAIAAVLERATVRSIRNHREIIAGWEELLRGTDVPGPFPQPLEQIVIRSGSSPLLESLDGADDATLVASLRRASTEMRALPQQTFGADRAISIIDALERNVDLGLPQIDEARAPAADPALPIVILLPGFMGVHLIDAVAGRVWLDSSAGLRGDLSARVALDESGTSDAFFGQRLMPDGLIRPIYADLMNALRSAGHAVHPFLFDFRRSLRDSTLLLRDFLTDLFARQANSKFVLVGHSMGALLACLVGDYLPELADRVEQTIFLGAPLGGTFDSVEIVIGTHWILPRLVASSPSESFQDFQDSVATWPGVFGMLPDPKAFPDCAPVFDALSWPPGVRVRQAMLDDAIMVKAQVSDSLLFRTGMPVFHLLATRFPTVGSLANTPGFSFSAGPRTCQGDGVVAARTGLPPGVTGYRTMFPHMQAPAEPAAIEAILDLIRTGACSLERIERDDVVPDIVMTAQLGENDLPLSVSEDVVRGVLFQDSGKIIA